MSKPVDFPIRIKGRCKEAGCEQVLECYEESEVETAIIAAIEKGVPPLTIIGARLVAELGAANVTHPMKTAIGEATAWFVEHVLDGFERTSKADLDGDPVFTKGMRFKRKVPLSVAREIMARKLDLVLQFLTDEALDELLAVLVAAKKERQAARTVQP